jgi:hypothetical protein
MRMSLQPLMSSLQNFQQQAKISFPHYYKLFDVLYCLQFHLLGVCVKFENLKCYILQKEEPIFLPRPSRLGNRLLAWCQLLYLLDSSDRDFKSIFYEPNRISSFKAGIPKCA